MCLVCLGYKSKRTQTNKKFKQNRKDFKRSTNGPDQKTNVNIKNKLTIEHRENEFLSDNKHRDEPKTLHASM